MEKLPFFNGSFDDCTSQDDISVYYKLVGDGKLSAEFFVIFKFPWSSEQVKETSEQVQIFASDAGDQKDGNDIFGRSYPLYKR